MVDAPEVLSRPTSHDSTIYVLSQLPLDICDMILRGIVILFVLCNYV